MTTADVTDRAGALAMFDRRRDGLSQVQNVLVDAESPLPCKACWEPRWKWAQRTDLRGASKAMGGGAVFRWRKVPPTLEEPKGSSIPACKWWCLPSRC